MASKNQNIRCWLNYFLISKTLISSTENSKICNAIKMDHKIISLKFNLAKEDRGPGFWKLNTSLLIDKDYKSVVSQLIKDKWSEHSDIIDLRVRYDFIKFEVKNASISYSKYLAKARRQQESVLSSKIK